MILVNAMGDACPIPVVKTKKAMQGVDGPEVIEVLVDNEIAVQNVTKMASSGGGKVSSKKVGEKEFKVTIMLGGEKISVSEQGEELSCIPDRKGDMIVVVSSDQMGEGNDDLGKVLIKGFLFAVTQMEELPKAMLFYNGGATLTCKGSASLEDLRTLEAQGVEILTCGTCLDYYGLKEQLAVGGVTNMYSIVETMSGASRIVKP